MADITTPESIWQNPFNKGKLTAPPVVSGDILVCSTASDLYGFNRVVPK